jgi:hypothetical protein
MEKKPRPLHLLIVIPPEQLPPGAQVIDARHIDLDLEDDDFGLDEPMQVVSRPQTPLRLPPGSRRRRSR